MLFVPATSGKTIAGDDIVTVILAVSQVKRRLVFVGQDRLLHKWMRTH